MIALSAFEDRPTVLEMLRAGAVGYLVKGTAGEEIVGSIQKVMAGGASLSSEVIAGIVHELTPAAPTRGGGREERDARRGEIERFVAGEGAVHGVPADRGALEPEHRRGRGAGAVPFAAARDHRTSGSPRRSSWRSGVQLELTTIAQALRELDRVPDGAYLAVNCSHRAAISSQLARLLGPDAGRIVLEITEHEAVEDYDALVDGARPAARAWAPASRSTTPARASRACATPCRSPPTS